MSDHPKELSDDIDQLLQAREQSNLLRSRIITTPLDAVRVSRNGRELINFAGNDYLGLSHHPRVLEAIRLAAPVGAGAAALISGYTPAHAAAEASLARLKSTEASVLFPSGYQANLAAVQTLVAVCDQTRRGVRFLIDKLVHASLVDAVRASGREFRVLPHNGIEKLRRLLRDAPAGQQQVVVTESIFSMDGNAADLRGIAGLKNQFDFVLLLDEAHGTGVYGAAGAGLAAELGVAGAVDLTVVTLSKAIGCQGGAVCASKRWCSAIVNFGRSYIYSTSIAVPVAAAIIEAIAVMRDEPQRQTRVRELANKFRRQASQWFDVPAGDSPIVPLVLGTESAAIEASNQLCEAGFLVPAVRPPTVPRGSSRLRITLSSEHSDRQLDQLLETIQRMGLKKSEPREDMGKAEK